MSEIVSGIWTVAGLLGGLCVVLLLSVVAVSLARGIYNTFKQEERRDGRR